MKLITDTPSREDATVFDCHRGPEVAKLLVERGEKIFQEWWHRKVILHVFLPCGTKHYVAEREATGDDLARVSNPYGRV